MIAQVLSAVLPSLAPLSARNLCFRVGDRALFVWASHENAYHQTKHEPGAHVLLREKEKVGLACDIKRIG